MVEKKGYFMEKDVKKRKSGISGNALRLWGVVFLVAGIVGRGVVQAHMLGMSGAGSAELLNILENMPNAMALTTLSIVLQVAETCALPIFAMLLIEGMQNTSDFKNYFKLFVSRDKKKMFLEVYDFSKKLIENKTYWDFDILSEKLYRKMKVFALVEAQCKKIEGIEYFKYTSMTLYTLKNFDNFISLIEDGIIRISFKINIFTTEERFGQIYDHGTGFEISKENLEKLYNRIKVIQ